MVIEGHYHLPFLSWIPKSFAHFYLKMTGRGNFYYEEHLSLRGLRRLVKGSRFMITLFPLFATPKDFLQPTFLIQGVRFCTSVFVGWLPIYILGSPPMYGY